MPVIRMEIVTKMVKVCVALKLGVPSSTTRIFSWLVLGGAPLAGVQEKMPPASIVAQEGAPGSRLNVSTCAGRSGSLTAAVNVSCWPAATLLFWMGERIGAELTSFTTMEKRCVALRLGTPLS